METCPYWREEDFRVLESAELFSTLGEVLMGVLSRFPKGSGVVIHQVCGPITTGGFGVEKNFSVMRAAVTHLRRSGHLVLDQTPLRPHVHRLWQRWKETAPPGKYCWEILYHIYYPVMRSRRVTVYLFLPGSRSSVGTRWEYRMAKALGLRAVGFPREEYERIVAQVLPV